jgi:cell division protein FtsW
MISAISLTNFSKPLETTFSLDKVLLLTMLALTSIGFVMMSSASIEFANEEFGSPFFHMYRQLVYIMLAMCAGALVFSVPMSVWQKYGWVLLFIGFFLLLLVAIPGIGREVNGSRRWLPLGVINLQSSEVAKFCILIYLAGYLVRRHDELRNHWKGFIKPIALLSIMIVLLLLEPDFGAVVVMVTACLGMIFLGGVKLLQFLTLILVSVAAVAVMAVSSDYRMQRLICFVDPWEQPFDCGYQLTQSLIAFGRGEWFGTGLGNSVQKLFFLPEAHTDFVFAILAEELGLIGGLIVLGLFVLLIGRIMVIGRRAEIASRFFSAYVAYGVGLVFSAQVIINIGVNAGLLPTKGLTLPFLSYGGSSMIISYCLVALLLRIEYELANSQTRQSPQKRGLGHD